MTTLETAQEKQIDWIALHYSDFRASITTSKYDAYAQGDIDVMAHTNAIRIFVDDQPVRSQKDADQFIQELAERREHYKENGVYKNDAQRQRALELLDQAIEKLRER